MHTVDFPIIAYTWMTISINAPSSKYTRDVEKYIDPYDDEARKLCLFSLSQLHFRYKGLPLRTPLPSITSNIFLALQHQTSIEVLSFLDHVDGMDSFRANEC